MVTFWTYAGESGTTLNTCTNICDWDYTYKRVSLAESRTSEEIIRVTGAPYWEFSYHIYIYIYTQKNN